MANSLFPAFVKIFYHSDVAQHVMTIPTKAWLGVPGDFTPGTFETWASGTIAGDDMVENLIDAMGAAMFTDAVDIDGYTIFHFPDADSDPVPVYSKSYPVTGSLVSATWYRAVQTTYMWRTSAFGLFKLVTLDGPSGDSYEDSLTWAGSSPGDTVHALIIGSANAWAGRDNGQPSVFLKYSRTLNDRALAKYGDTPL